MKLLCKLIRPGGTLVTLDGVDYHFKPNAKGEHECEVADEAHQQVLLGIPEAYVDPSVPAPKQVAPLGVEDDGDDELLFAMPDGTAINVEKATADQLRSIAANADIDLPKGALSKSELKAIVVAALSED